MKETLICILLCSLLLPSCKKNDSKDPDKKDQTDPNKQSYSGRLSTFGGYPVYYNSDGMLTEYSFNDWQNAYEKSTITLTWASNTMTFDRTGGAFGLVHAVYNRNAFGYCEQSSQDNAHTWQYDSLNRIKTLDGITYYWTGENVDSIQYLGLTEIYEYSSALETRNIGMKFIPRLLSMYPIIGKNLRIKMTRVHTSARDTTDVHYYGHEFNTAGKVIRETDTTKVHDTIQNIVTGNYSYYE